MLRMHETTEKAVKTRKIVKKKKKAHKGYANATKKKYINCIGKILRTVTVETQNYSSYVVLSGGNFKTRYYSYKKTLNTNRNKKTKQNR